jgi:hypothetical protein
MNIDLSHPGLDTRRKKKFIQGCLHRINWIKVSKESEWVWASIESEKEIICFTRWISEQQIDYPVNASLFDYQWYETSSILLCNEFDVLNLFKTTRILYLISNNMEWIVEYSTTCQVARFGTMNF